MADFPPTLMHLSIQNQARGVSARLFPSRFTDFSFALYGFFAAEA
jgi:hypothetical protein